MFTVDLDVNATAPRCFRSSCNLESSEFSARYFYVLILAEDAIASSVLLQVLFAHADVLQHSEIRRIIFVKIQNVQRVSPFVAG